MNYTKTFSVVYDPFMYLLERYFLKKHRSQLLSGLSGKIFEVGVGTGINLEHYNHQAQVTGIEPSPFMIPRAVRKKNRLRFPERFELYTLGCGYPETEDLFTPGSLDAVVCTLVLCTIPDPVKAVENFMKWLKPGGTLVVLEHIRSHNRIEATMQDSIRSLWEKVGEGCQINRPTDIILAESGFRMEWQEYFHLFIPFYKARFVKPEGSGGL
jgi:SAM-dependent methyltransferase